MTSVAVIGASGYVGSRLDEVLRCGGDHEVTSVTRANYAEMREATYDLVINCAMPAARYGAQKDPNKDFVETVQKTAHIVHAWTAGKFIQVSTVSARCQLDTVYGRHKAAAETIANFGGNLIVRLGSMYDASLTKGVLIDMLNGRKVYVSGESRYCFASLDFVAEWIAGNLHRTGIVEVGARNSVALREVAAHIGSASEFGEYLDHQEIVDPAPDFPDARDVLGWIAGQKRVESKEEKGSAE